MTDTLKKLEQEMAAIQTQIEKEKKRGEALEKVKQVAEEHGYTLAELLGETSKAPKRQKTKAAPKYANPDDPSKTWTGRGRKPQWLVEYLEAGRDLEACEIAS